MKVKICGITNVEDARIAESLGADYVGMVFARSSPRCVDVAIARQITHRLTRALAVGVFVEQSIDEIERMAARVGLDVVQRYSACSRRIQGITHIRAVRVRDRRSLATIGSGLEELYLLDAFSEDAMGGTGRPFDWSLLPDALDNVLLSGGINSHNIAAACSLRPYAVDVCSGVERAPGLKDPRKMEQLFERIQA